MTERVLVLGADELRSSVVALGFEVASEDARVAVIDLRDAQSVAGAGALPAEIARVLVAGEEQRPLIAAMGVDPARVAWSREAAAIGPALMAALPQRPRPPTRRVLVTGVRGGVGRTLLVTNLARRLARRCRVCVVDATGTGVAGWWLGCDAGPWSALEGLVDEMSADHLGVVASEPSPGLRLLGGPPVTPTASLLVATIRAAASLDDLVVVDAPLASDALTRAARPAADRRLVLAYDDPWSVTALAALATADDWLLASQTSVTALGEHRVFRSLPRDERAITSALRSRAQVGGRLGRAYDDLAELLLIDAS